VAALALAVAAAASGIASGAPLRSITPAPGDLLRGESDGVAVSSRGLLYLAPKPRPLGEPLRDGTPAYVWSVAVDDEGRVIAGTGPDGKVVRAAPAESMRIVHTTPEPLVTAVAALPGGVVLAATAPEGRIYRVPQGGPATEWSETGEHYVWSLLPRPDGSVLAATGESGRLLRVDRTGRATVLFDSDESHLVALAPGRDGNVLAGGAGRGLVYRIDPRGAARVLHDDDLPEARSVAEDEAGNVYVALLAPPAPDRRPPAVRIQVGGAGQPGSEMMGDLDERDGGTLRGVIEGLPSEQADTSLLPRGRVIRISPDGTVTELWRSATEAAFSLGFDAAGGLLFGTGEPARLYRVASDGEVSLLATLREGQVTAIARSGRGVVLATSNPASLYRLEPEPVESGTFVSRPLDAGAAARWGSLTWRTAGPSSRAEYQTRSGNSGEPDATWSDWSTALTVAEGSPIPSPPARFLQWRARLSGSGERAGGTAPATATFATENRSPRVRDFRLDGATPWTAERASFRWSAQDPDGDPVTSILEVRRPGAGAWSAVSRTDAPSPKAADLGGEPETAWREARGTWDTTASEEGDWEVRVVVQDAASNPPGEGKDDAADPPLRMTVDRSSPTVEFRRTGDVVDVTVTDGASPVVRLEIVKDGAVLGAAACLDGVCDSRRETFRVTGAAASPGAGTSVRAYDAAGNVAEAPLP
jgi:hypothetical protein